MTSADEYCQINEILIEKINTLDLQQVSNKFEFTDKFTSELTMCFEKNY